MCLEGDNMKKFVLHAALNFTIIFATLFLFSANVYAADITAANNTELTSMIHSNLSNFSSNFNIKYSGKKIDNIDSVIKESLNQDPYINSNINSIKWNITGSANNYNLSIKVNYISTDDERKETAKLIDSILSSIIRPYMNDHEKVKTVHDYIIKNGQYDTQLKLYSEYNLLKDGKSVCNGYALLTYDMLKKLGIPVKLVSGTSDSNQPHIWNLVKLGDYWFHLDTTWDDPVPDKKETVSYNYYLLTDDEISKDHKISKNQNLPKAYKKYYKYLKDLIISEKNNYSYKKILTETGLDIYNEENTASNINELTDILENKIKYHPSVLSARFSKSISSDDVTDSISELFKNKSVSEIRHEPFYSDSTNNYYILKLFIKYTDTPENIKTDLSSDVYNIDSNVKFNVYAIYGTRKENITDDVLIYPYDDSFMNVSGNSLNFNDAGYGDLIFEYEGKRKVVNIKAISPIGFDYITDEKSKNPVNVKIFDQYIDFSNINQWPFIENNRTMVPLKAVFDVLNCDIQWDESSKTVVVEHGTSKITIYADSQTAYINDEAKSLDVPAKIVNSRIVVPLRFISEAIERTIIWDNTENTVLIY